jgi:hypothetical protein
MPVFRARKPLDRDTLERTILSFYMGTIAPDSESLDATDQTAQRE